MDYKELINNKEVKAKEKVIILSRWIEDNPKELTGLIEFARNCKDSAKATCIEALEFATKMNPKIGIEDCFNFVTQTLTEKAPRIKWESARVIGNIAHLYPTKLDEAISNLLANTEHTGTVVRWSAAFALGEIIKIKSKQNKDLIPAIESICNREEKKSIKKIYIAALKKVK
jgi:HEAT repeat protein